MITMLWLTCRKETRGANVLLLKVKFPNATGLNRNTDHVTRDPFDKDQQFTFSNWSTSEFAANALEPLFETPIVDQTGLARGFDIKVDLKPDFAEADISELRQILEQALSDQLGLELVPTNMPIKMLVVEKAK